MINVMNFARRYADQIGGQFTDYDHSKAVLVIPLKDGRFQTVLAISRTGPTTGKDQAVFTSKICEYESSVDLKELLEETINFDYSKFIIEDNYIKIEASCVATAATEEEVKNMIQEVATLADQYELKYTGQDVH
jgi:hypothetical protein